MDENEEIVRHWFNLWSEGNYKSLPLSQNFIHYSPFGTIEGKQTYLDLVAANEDKFIGYQFEILDLISMDDKVAVRYNTKQHDFEMEVSEWHYIENGLISIIHAYYHIGEIREERKIDI